MWAKVEDGQAWRHPARRSTWTERRCGELPDQDGAGERRPELGDQGGGVAGAFAFTRGIAPWLRMCKSEKFDNKWTFPPTIILHPIEIKWSITRLDLNHTTRKSLIRGLNLRDHCYSEKVARVKKVPCRCYVDNG